MSISISLDSFQSSFIHPNKTLKFSLLMLYFKFLTLSFYCTNKCLKPTLTLTKKGNNFRNIGQNSIPFIVCSALFFRICVADYLPQFDTKASSPGGVTLWTKHCRLTIFARLAHGYLRHQRASGEDVYDNENVIRNFNSRLCNHSILFKSFGFQNIY